MSVEQNKAILKRYYAEVFNNSDLSNWNEMVDESYVMHVVGATQPAKGIEGMKQNLAQREASAPDAKMSIDEMVAEGEIISIRGKATGTHTGELQGIKPTGKKFSREFAAFYRFKDGKIAEGWALHDFLGFYWQLGVTPPSAPAST